METKRYIGFGLFFLASLLALPFSGSAQQVNTTSSYACPGSQVVFFIMGGPNCGSPAVTSQSNWTVSPSTGVSIQYVQTSSSPVAYNQIRVTFQNAATYTISANYSCPSGGTPGSDSRSFTVYSSVQPQIDISANKSSICGDGQEVVTFSAANLQHGGTNPIYSWRINGNVVSGESGSSFATSSLDAGDDVTVSLSTNAPCASPSFVTSAPLSIAVTDPLDVTVSLQEVTDSPVCPGGRVRITATGGNWGTTPSAYQWYVNDNPVTPPDNYLPEQPAHTHFVDNTWDYPDNSTVRLEITSSEACATPKPKGSNALTIDVGQDEPFTVGFAVLPSKSPPLAYCEDEISFQANASHPTSNYQWYKNDVPLDNNHVDPSIYDPVFISQGDVIKVRATIGADPCISGTSAEYSVPMNGAPFSIKSPVSVTGIICASGETLCSTNRRCQGAGTTDFNATASNADSFAWTLENAGNSTINASTGVVTWDASFYGTATVKFTAQGCEGPKVSSRTITVDPFGGNVTVSLQEVTDSPVCPGGQVRITATGSNWGTTPSSYQWYVNDNPVTPPDNYLPEQPAHTHFVDNTWDYPDNSTVRLEITSSEACATPKPKGSNALTIDVGQDEPFTVGFAVLPSKSPPLAYCEDEISFQANASHPTSNYQWYKNDVPLDNNHADPSIYDPVFISQGDVIKVRATIGADPCISGTSAEYSVPMNGAPFSIKSPVSVTGVICASGETLCSTNRRCQGAGTTDFNATASNADSFIWTLENAGSSTINASSGVVTWDASFYGTATVKFTAQGCEGPKVSSRTITVDPFGGNVTVSLQEVTDSPVCPGGQVRITATGSNWGTTPSAYQWYVNDNPVTPPDNYLPEQPAHTHFVDNTWDYPDNSTVRLEITSSVACATPKPKGSNALTIDVGQDEPFTVGFAVLPSKSPPLAYCEDEISFQANASHPTSNYQWYKNDVPLDNNHADPSIYDPVFISQGDVIKVRATIGADPCISGTSAEYSVPMNGAPFSIKSPVSVTGIICASGETLCSTNRRCQGAGTTDFNATASNADSFAWTLENAGNSTINASTGVVTWDAGFYGTATVKFTAQGCGGPQTSSREIEVQPTLPAMSLSISTGFTEICPGSEIRFWISSESDVPPGATYAWYVNGAERENNPDNLAEFPPPQSDPDKNFARESWSEPDNAVVVCKVSAPGCYPQDPAPSNEIVMPHRTIENFTVEIGVEPFRYPAVYCADEVTFEAIASHPAVVHWYKNDDLLHTGMAYDPVFYVSTDEIRIVATSDDAGACFQNSVPQTAEAALNKDFFEIQEPVGVPEVFSTSGTDQCQDGADSHFYAVADAATSFIWSITPGAGTLTPSGTQNSSVAVDWAPDFTGAAAIEVTAVGCLDDQNDDFPYEIHPKPATPDFQTALFCDFDLVQLQGTPNAQVAEFRWFNNNGEYLATGTEYPVGILRAGMYAYQAEAVSVYGCISAERKLLPVQVVSSCDDNLSWIETISYSPVEPGTDEVIARGKSYFDLTGTLLQNQTWRRIPNETGGFDEQVWATQPIRDEFGREVVQTFPAPTGQSDFQYKHWFVVAQDGTRYDHSHFDEPVDDEQGTLGAYFAPNDEHRPVTGYPYSRADFYDDGTGEPRYAAGPGETHRLGSGHETLSGTFPVYDELGDYLERRLVALPGIQQDGSLANEGVQSVARDENGRLAVSIADKSGKAVLSGRAGTEEDHVLAMNNVVKSGGDPLADPSSPDYFPYRPMTYFYLLEDGPVTITGSADFVAEDIVSNTGKDPGETFADAEGIWPAGFYRILLNNTASAITLSYTNYLLDVSCQFYDDAGRLRVSVSPNGYLTWTQAPDDYALIDKTTYTYNHQGWLLSMTEPDAGTTNYVYRKDGKIRFSRNASQAGSNRFSYTHYDKLGRPVESGEYQGTDLTFVPMDDANFAASAMNSLLEMPADEITWNIADRSDWVRTHYDYPYTIQEGDPIPNLPAQAFVQHFVRGAVSWTENAHIRTWYSYDEMGRVVWMAQQPAALQRTFLTEYQYDFLGNVLQVVNSTYENGTRSFEFYHHYAYDVERRLHQVHTSTDGSDRKLRATYEYYLHGPLKRIVLGNDLQGIDFVYNIHGWLTQINHPDADQDPGDDGNDVFGMVLDYYESALTDLFQTAMVPSPRDPSRHHRLIDAEYILEQSALTTGAQIAFRTAGADWRQSIRGMLDMSAKQGEAHDGTLNR